MKFPKKLSLYHKIVLKRSIPFVIGILLVTSLWLLLKPQKSEVVASFMITDGGNTISFNSGFYTVDTLGNVYEKDGSVIQNTPDTLKSYSHLSYLSRPITGTNIKGKNVIVNGDAVVLMEGVQQLANLTLNGGTVSQPQPDRSGNINAIQYSDQEWAIEFLTYLKVPAGQTRKVTCPTDYYVDASNQMGNGCIVEYSETYDGSKMISEIDDWVTMDKVWQADATTFNQLRYTIPAAPYIDNSSGIERYYPLRIRFKNDNRDERNESMAVVLRDSLNNIVAGSEVAMPLNNIYGPASNGFVDITYSGKAIFNYYLLDNYVATEANPEQGWILDDLSNAYATYSNNELSFNTFFAGYGRKTSGLFDLIFDDNTNINAYDATYASSPFAKGTSTVFSEEAQYSYIRSTKTINPNMEQGSRYQSLGLRLSISGSLELNGGVIDLKGKGLPGYDFELRRGTDSNAVTLFGNKRGAGYQTTPNSGGLSTDLRPQSAAHGYYGGAGDTTTGNYTGNNTNTYGDVLQSDTPGSGGGASYNGALPPNIGGDGGGVVAVSADTVKISSNSSFIDVSGSDGIGIYSGHSNYFAGGSGGSISIGARNLDVHNITKEYFFSTGGMYNHANSSGGAGGYVKVVVQDFLKDGDIGGTEAELIGIIDCSGGRESNTDFLGADGGIHVEVGVSPQDIGVENLIPQKTITVNGRGSNIDGDGVLDKLYYGDKVAMELRIKGAADSSVRIRQPIDVILTTDLSGSMNYCSDPSAGDIVCPNPETRLKNLKEAIHQFLVTANSLNERYGPLIRIGLVTFSGYGVLPPPDNPTSVQGSTLYSKAGTTLFSSRNDLLGLSDSIDSYVRGITADGSTPTGAGLNRSIDILQSQQSTAKRKHIILVTDGEEKQHPCTFGPGIEAPEIDANKWDCPLPSPLDDIEAGYPLNRLRSDGDISLFTIGVGVSGVFKDYLEYMSIEQPTYMDEDTPTFYEYNTYGDLGLVDIFNDILDVITQSGQGMSFVFDETLPPGAEIVAGPEIHRITPSGSEELLSGTPCTILDTNKLSCSVGSGYYNEDMVASDNIFVIRFSFNINNVAPGWTDIDQNSQCDENGIVGNPDNVRSLVTYLPSGPYIPPNYVLTPSICMNIIPNEVAGDVFNMGDYLNHYVFRGKNLSINSNDENEISWNVDAYSENPSSQMSKDDVTEYLERIKSMNNEAATTNTLNTPSNRWNLQNLAIDSAANSQRKIFPEGKVWRYETGYHSYGNISYSGIGTVIFNNNLTITSGAKIQKISSGNDSLGLIVLGDLHLQEGSEIDANILCIGNVYFDGNNINIKGSILASDYQNMENKHGNKITYDYKIGEKWPPGFKFFKMPIPVSTKP